MTTEWALPNFDYSLPSLNRDLKKASNSKIVGIVFSVGAAVAAASMALFSITALPVASPVLLAVASIGIYLLVRDESSNEERRIYIAKRCSQGDFSDTNGFFLLGSVDKMKIILNRLSVSDYPDMWHADLNEDHQGLVRQFLVAKIHTGEITEVRSPTLAYTCQPLISCILLEKIARNGYTQTALQYPKLMHMVPQDRLVACLNLEAKYSDWESFIAKHGTIPLQVIERLDLKEILDTCFGKDIVGYFKSPSAMLNPKFFNNRYAAALDKYRRLHSRLDRMQVEWERSHCDVVSDLVFLDRGVITQEVYNARHANAIARHQEELRKYEKQETEEINTFYTQGS